MYKFREDLANLIQLYNINEEMGLTGSEMATIVMQFLDTWKESLLEDEPETSDGEALASAGFGTDEDYGGGQDHI